MRKSTGYGLKKHLSLLMLLFTLLAHTSCSPESEHKIPAETAIPEESMPEATPPEEIGYTEYERIPDYERITEREEITSNERIIKNNVYLGDENVGSLTESALLAKLTLLAAETDIAPINATMSSKTWKVIKGKMGKKLNVQLTLENLLNADEGEKVAAVIEKVSPAVTSKKLASNITMIGNYTTRLLNRTRNRVNNIGIAAEKLNYYKLLPGQEFSFNKAVGRRSKDKGYEKATIFIKTKAGPKEILAYGGGVCQLSTTLFNAVDKSNMEILERHRHSKKVAYVPSGKDATVSYGSADFRFKNSGSYPIMIRTSLSSKYLNVKIIENRN